MEAGQKAKNLACEAGVSADLSLDSRGAEGRDSKRRLGLVEQLRDVAFAIQTHRMSERQACKLFDVGRTSYHYEPQPDAGGLLRKELIELARQKPRYGNRRVWTIQTGVAGESQARGKAVSRGTPSSAAAEAETAASSRGAHDHCATAESRVVDRLPDGRLGQRTGDPRADHRR